MKQGRQFDPHCTGKTLKKKKEKSWLNFRKIRQRLQRNIEKEACKEKCQVIWQKKKTTIDKNIIHPRAELTPLFRAAQDSEFGHALYPVHVCVHSIVTRAQNIKTSEHADHSPASVECNHSVSPFLCLSLPQHRLILTPHIGNSGNGYQITCYHSPLQRAAQGEWPPCSHAFTHTETHWHRYRNAKEKIFKISLISLEVTFFF